MDALLAYIAQHKETASAYAAIASACAAVFAVLVSMVSVYIARTTLQHQRRHSVLSVTPIPEVTVADYEQSLRVKIGNHGSGPLIIKDFNVGDGTRVEKSIIDWMPELPKGIDWAHFSGNIDKRSILPGHEIVLVQLDGDDTTKPFIVARDMTRTTLQPLTVNVEFTDVYNTPMMPYQKQLSWFGRHFDE